MHPLLCDRDLDCGFLYLMRHKKEEFDRRVPLVIFLMPKWFYGKHIKRVKNLIHPVLRSIMMDERYCVERFGP